MTIETLYQQMLAAMGPRHWLQAGIPPAETPWEILWGYSRSEYQLAQRGLRTG
ncbi:hypothetical protein [Lactiplantibacillus plantarum]|uniref:hypothetical protein n=1 Tax=Lactiplantibacillus plantarum TaxID=1590 RepID=UPI001F34BF00|nr:hypothetical protein [Lactiplantibacillus plantarum]UJM24123.1 hypothetical protein L1599_13575 [Lactiplantibacillus plantarum]WRM27936.1 hypothetical protein UHT29_14275 [Lactiplantibacillus plantarum]